MHSLTKACGLLILIAAVMSLIMGLVDMAPEWTSAARTLVKGGAGSAALPVATSVKYKIGAEFAVDVIVAGLIALFGWFLFTSEIQQPWAVVVVGLIIVASIVIRSTPLLPLSTGKLSAGYAFWGAKVYTDVYRPPRPPDDRRSVQTFPPTKYVTLAVTKSGLSGEQAHPAESVVLDFGKKPNLIQEYAGQGGSATVIGSLAGTRVILDNDFEKIVYSVPHLMVEKVEPASGR